MSSCAHSSLITTAPAGAEVYALTAKGERGTLLGKSPVAFDKDALGIEVVKNGYQPAIIYMPHESLPRYEEYKLVLTTETQSRLRNSVFEVQPGIINDALQDILKLQLYINENKFGDAELFIKQNKEKYDRIAVFHILEGHELYLKKDIKASQAAFERALECDPKNEEAQEMISLLKSLRH